jgi:hypothetical protein
MSRPEPLSARILPLADGLHQLAHQVARHDPALGSQLILKAAQVGLLQPAALALERDLARAYRTVDEIHADAAEDADMPIPLRAAACPTATEVARMVTRQRRARVIAEILAPVLRHPGQP